MTNSVKLSRLGFAIIKFKINGDDVFFMRLDRRWNDVSFIGGHEQSRDKSNLQRAARRELLEEVPALRTFCGFDLSPLTDELSLEPSYSASSQRMVRYQLRFFHLKFLMNPSSVLDSISSRSANVLVRREELERESRFKVSKLVRILREALPAGLSGVPFSWDDDFGDYLRDIGGARFAQQEISFR